MSKISEGIFWGKCCFAVPPLPLFKAEIASDLLLLGPILFNCDGSLAFLASTSALHGKAAFRLFPVICG